jgi:hypothetical protein
LQKRSSDLVANAPKVDQQKKKRTMSGSITNLMNPKPDEASKEDKVRF